MEVFFYGLFMDEDVLSEKGISYENPRKAMLNGYALKIGERASLVSSPNEKSYGVLMTVKQHEMNHLYAEKSVSDYVPEKLTVTTEQNESISATCYNLPPEKLSGNNVKYARALHALAERLELPRDYLEEIKQFTKEQA